MASCGEEVLNARIALDYLNSQLKANHKAAETRYEEYSKQNKLEDYKLSYAWAQYSAKARGIDGIALQISFTTPSLSFICDHDALLQLNVKAVLRGDPPETLSKDFSVTYRVTTERRIIVGNDTKVGDYESRIRLLVFNLEQATLVKPPSDETKEALEDLDLHLTRYLRSLQNGGHHVLFVPPEFYADDLRTPIDLSLSGNEADSIKPGYFLRNIKGHTPEVINDYLSLLWYTCASVARERSERSEAKRDTSLAVFRTWEHKGYSSQWHSYLEFGVPRVDILCTREVVLYFSLTGVTFYNHSEITTTGFRETKTREFSKWTIAFIVDVIADFAGVKLGLQTKRFSRRYSTYDLAGNTEREQALTALIKFLEKEYLVIVGKNRLQYLLHRLQDDQLRDSEYGTSIESDGSWWMLERASGLGGSSSLDTAIKDTDMHGFDVVFAISQASINMQLRAGLSKKRDIFQQWDSNTFTIEVKSVDVRLMKDQKTMVVVNILEGSLKSSLNADLELKAQAAEIKFRDCRLAFEVPIKSKGKDPSTKSCSFTQIYLDLEHAELSAAGTNFDHEKFCRSEQDVRMTLIHLVNKEYLRKLAEEELHILATIPVYSQQSASFYKLTRLVYKTYDVTVNEVGAPHGGGRAEQMLFVLGMTGGIEPLNADSFTPTTNWIVRGRSHVSHGVFAVSSRGFTSRLNTLLADVNGLTTLVPVSPSAKSSPNVEIVQMWATHPEFREQPCEWSPVGLDGNRYEWKFYREWSLREQGSKASMKGEYTIYCATENEFELLDLTESEDNCLAVRMSGMMRLRISTTRAEKTESTEATASWDATLSLKTKSDGSVKVNIETSDTTGLRYPPPKIPRRASLNIPNVHQVLKRHLPNNSNFDAIREEFEELQGEWKHYLPSVYKFALYSPTFNNHGDLLFELGRAPQHAFQVVLPATTEVN